MVQRNDLAQLSGRNDVPSDFCQLRSAAELESTYVRWGACPLQAKSLLSDVLWGALTP
jgi:hypothetical protein